MQNSMKIIWKKNSRLNTEFKMYIFWQNSNVCNLNYVCIKPVRDIRGILRNVIEITLLLAGYSHEKRIR